jgi:hypothetical protein
MFPEEHDQSVTFLSEFHAGSVGETLKLLSDLSLSTETVQAVIVNPNGLRYVITATVSSDGTYAYITTTANTFPYPGTYTIMPQIVLATMPVTYTDAAEFTIDVAASL